MATSKPSLSNGIWASSPIATDIPTSGKTATGWTVETPPFEWQNWWQNRVDSFMFHVNEYGIPQWDAATDYPANAITMLDGVMYKSLQTPNVNKNPSSQTAYWVKTEGAEAYPNKYGVHQWDSAVDYPTNAIVMLSNVMYRSLQTPNIDKNPSSQTAYWVKTAGAEANNLTLKAASNLSDVANATTAFTNIKQAASTTATGVVEAATQAEMDAGTASKYPAANVIKSFTESAYIRKDSITITSETKALDGELTGLGSMRFSRIGGQVVIGAVAQLSAGSSDTVFLTSTGFVPASYRPTVTNASTSFVVGSTSYVMTVTSAGLISFAGWDVSTGTAKAVAPANFSNLSLSFNVA